MPSDFKIENDIPIPQPKSASLAKYPWKEMAVGDSFLIPREGEEPRRRTRERVSGIIQYAKRYGQKYCTRATDDGIRVWRIE